jgi:sugar diacid utilization regulator
MPALQSSERVNLVLQDDGPLDQDLLTRCRSTLNLMLLQSDDSFMQMVQAIKGVFEAQTQINNFSSRLLTMVQDGVKPQSLLEASYEFFGNPILLTDPSLCLLGSVGTNPVADEPVIEYVLKNGYMPEEYLEEVMHEESQPAKDDKVLIIWEKDFLKHRLIAGRVVFENRLVGYIKVFEYNRQFTPYLDTEVLKLLCQFMAVSIATSSISDRGGKPFIETLLTDILDKRLVNQSAIEERADLYKLELRHWKTALTVRLDEQFKKTDKLYLLKQKLVNHFNRTTIFIYNEDLVVLDDRDSAEELFDPKRIQALEALLEDNNCRATYSLPFRNLHAFERFFQQTLACYTIAEKLRIPSRIIRYEDIKIPHMLIRFSEHMNLRDLLTLPVRELMAIDQNRGSQLTQTLFSFVQHNQDMKRTADDLHVHYNTLKYRINRINELTGIDLANEETIFSTLLSKKVMDLLEYMDQNEG